MRGLFLNGYYSAIGNIKLFLLFVFAAAAILLVTGSPTAQELFVYLTVTAFSVNGVVSMRKDAGSKWNKYEITLPVRRKDIIKCKYLSYLFWVLAGTAIAAVVTAMAVLIHGGSGLPVDPKNLCSTFVLGIGISMMTGACFYPLSYVFGIEKSETVLIISLIASIIIAVGCLHVLNSFLFSFYLRMMAFAIGYILLFAASYGVTLCLYRKKEF